MDIFEAVNHGTIDDLQRAVKDCPDLNTFDDWRHTPAYYAASSGKLDMVVFLMESGAKALLSHPSLQLNALDAAAENGHLGVAQAIVESTPKIQEADLSHALMYASLSNSTDIMTYLLEHGANPNYKSDDKLRPIDMTTGRPCEEAFAILLPLTDRWYRKSSQRRIELTRIQNLERERRNTPTEKAKQARKRDAALKKWRTEPSVLDQLANGELDIGSASPDSED